MKKIIPALAILGGAAAFVIYKMKKDEQKQIVDLDQGLLYDDEDTLDDEIEEGPISDPKACCEDIEEAMEDAMETAKDTVEDVAEDVKKKLKKSYDDVKEGMENFDESFLHLLKSEVASLIEKSKEIVKGMSEAGDVHEHERPIQHTVTFTSQADMDAFKSEIISKGFVITKGEDELELSILHISSINEEKLFATILYLADVAKANNGSYEGWISKTLF